MEINKINACLITDAGFIKLNRNILAWEWYNNLPVRVLYVHCLLKANYTAKNWQGQVIKAGQFVTSLKHLSEETALTQRQTRTALNHLKSTGELTIKTTSRYSIITVNNWHKWQSERQAIGQTSDKQTTTTKEYKESKNINNNILGHDKKFKKPTLEEIQSYCSERKNNVDPQRFFDYYESVDWHIGKNKMKNWQACIRNWEKNTRTNTKQEENTFNELPYNPYC